MSIERVTVDYRLSRSVAGLRQFFRSATKQTKNKKNSLTKILFLSNETRTRRKFHGHVVSNIPSFTQVWSEIHLIPGLTSTHVGFGAEGHDEEGEPKTMPKCLTRTERDIMSTQSVDAKTSPSVENRKLSLSNTCWLLIRLLFDM